MNDKNSSEKSPSVELISEDKSSSNKKSNNPKHDEYIIKFNGNGSSDSEHNLISKKNKTKKNSRMYIPNTERILYNFEEKKSNNNSRKVEKKQSSFTNIKNKFNNIKKRIIPKIIKISDKESSNKSSSININKCLICAEKLSDNEKEDNSLSCSHLICNSCYFLYLKEKINNNHIDKITCCQKDCKTILYNEFIRKKIQQDKELFDKYEKLKKRRQIMLNHNIQLCPIADCDSYAKKIDKNIFVKCIDNNHEFCFNCLKGWHIGKECDTKIENKSLDEYIKVNDIRRCPKCKIAVQKNEGCNHIICSNCKCEFCWLCLSECNYDHFKSGRCVGLLYNNTRCCNNRIINFLYHVLISFAKFIIFGIGIPFIETYMSFYNHSEKYFVYNDYINILSGICGVLTLLKFLIFFIPYTFILSFICLFYWEMQEKLFVFEPSKICDYFIKAHTSCFEKFEK